MCFPTDDGIPGPGEPEHLCIGACPVCWILTKENILLLAAGRTLKLGLLSDLIAAMQAGCEFAQLLVQVTLNCRRGGEFLVDATLDVKVEYPEPNTLPELKELSFVVTNPMDSLFAIGGSGLNDFEFLSFTFPMGVLARGGAFEEYCKRKHPDPNPASTAAYDTARGWISDCLALHDDCPKKSPAESVLPKRVLDVTADCGPERVKLHVSNGERAQYTALSYCWGSTRQLTTTLATLETFKEDGILVTQLPKTLQDAISVARELRVKYIWIDSLCIIQDSVQDKNIEIAQMPHIYKNAVVTIFAALAKDSNDGFLQERFIVKDRIISTFGIPYFSDIGSEEVPATISGKGYICVDKELGYHITDFRDEPINSRAWTMQEAWLSPRLLIYGSGPLKWQCLSTHNTHGLEVDDHKDFNEERYFENRSKFFTIAEPDVSETLDSLQIKGEGATSKKTDIEMQKEWENLLYLYSTRALSVPTDKLPALSAIAAEFHRLTGDEYLAGLWKRHLPWALLWYPMFDSLEGEEIPTSAEMIKGKNKKEAAEKKKKEKEEKDKKEKWTSRAWKKIKSSKDKERSKETDIPEEQSANTSRPTTSAEISKQPYIAPSWSPASSTHTISFNKRLSNLSRTLISIHSAQTTVLTPLVPFGTVTSGSLILTGPMQYLSWTQIMSYFVICVQGSPHIRWDYILPDKGHLNADFLAAATKAAKMGYGMELNEQYLVTDILSSYLGAAAAQDVNIAERPRPADSREQGMRAKTPRHTDLGKEIPPGFWFLEISWDHVPVGLVLVENEDGTFRRTGFFKCGRNSGRGTDGLSYDIGPRRFDWDKNLSMYTVEIV